MEERIQEFRFILNGNVEISMKVVDNQIRVFSDTTLHIIPRASNSVRIETELYQEETTS